MIELAVELQPVAAAIADDVYAFVLDRLRGYALEHLDVSVEMFEAVRERQPRSLVDFADRLLAVREFVGLESAESLAAANKRIANILRQAEFDNAGSLDRSLLDDGAEKALFAALDDAQRDVGPLIDARAYGDALARLAELRPSVDAFFDDVMVMVDEPAIRQNRLCLLATLREQFLRVADVSRLAIK